MAARAQEEVTTQRRTSIAWKILALLASGTAAALAVMTLRVPPPKPVSTAAYVAVLSDPRTQKPVLYVTARREESQLRVKALEPSIDMADASLELWALPKGAKPRSLGLLQGERALLPLAGIADQALGDVPMLAVSLEPQGGSRTGAPTGRVLYSGPCVRDW